jgi:hypothetical protein
MKLILYLLAFFLFLASPAWATFPTVAGTAATYVASGTSWACALPASVAAGDLLFVFVSGDSAISDVKYPGSWVELWDLNGVSNLFSGAYLVAAGGETSVTVSLNGGSADDLVCLTYRITGWHGTTPPEDGVAVEHDTPAHPNPPSLTPSWGAEDTLWIAVGSAGRCEDTNYSGLVSQNGDSDGSPVNCSNDTQPSIGAAVRSLNATSDNPGAFTISNTASGGGSNTVAVRPGVSARRPIQTIFME